MFALPASMGGLIAVLCLGSPQAIGHKITPRPIPATLTVVTDHKSYKTGDPIHVTITATNGTKDAIQLSFPTSQRFDLELRRANATGAGIWQWSRGRMFADVFTTTSLEPGKSMTFQATYPPADASRLSPAPPLAAGAYILTATLTTAGMAKRATGTTTITVK